jgi:hypothetical protein
MVRRDVVLDVDHLPLVYTSSISRLEGWGRHTIFTVWSQEAETNWSFCRLFQSTECTSAECSCQTCVGRPCASASSLSCAFDPREKAHLKGHVEQSQRPIPTPSNHLISTISPLPIKTYSWDSFHATSYTESWVSNLLSAWSPSTTYHLTTWIPPGVKLKIWSLPLPTKPKFAPEATAIRSSKNGEKAIEWCANPGVFVRRIFGLFILSPLI